jgi:hypothetical protein
MERTAFDEVYAKGIARRLIARSSTVVCNLGTTSLITS